MKLPLKKIFWLALPACLLLAVGLAFAFQSRLSCAVAVVWQGLQIESFLRKPGVSYVETQFLIKPDFASDVIFGVDQEFIEGIKSPLYVKGGDYDMETLLATSVVRSWGGRSVAIPFVDGYSTTSLIHRIRGDSA